MNLLRSEWTKLRSVRTTWITALGTVVAALAVGLLGVTSQIGAGNAELPELWDPTAISLKGLLVGQLLIGMLGASAITSEYSTGMITTSLSIVPRRSLMLAAKAASTAALAAGTALVTVAASFFAGQAVIGASGLPVASVTDPDVIRALINATLYLILIALVGLGLGTVTRSASGALGVLVAFTLLAPALTPALPGPIGDAIAKYWPATAGQASYAVIASADGLLPWVGIGVLAIFTVYLTAASHLVLRLRDA